MDAKHYGEQVTLDNAIDDLAFNLRVSRIELHITAMAKGEVFGDLVVEYDGEVRDFSRTSCVRSIFVEFAHLHPTLF